MQFQDIKLISFCIPFDFINMFSKNPLHNVNKLSHNKNINQNDRKPFINKLSLKIEFIDFNHVTEIPKEQMNNYNEFKSVTAYKFFINV